MQRVRMGIGLFRRRHICLFVIYLGIIAAYYPTFRGEFILDDVPFVKNNPFVRDLQPLASYFLQEDGIVGDQEGRAHSGYYRPLTTLSYRMDYLIWGMNSAGFRATNLILHLLTCLLLYLCTSRVLKEGAGPLIAVLLFGLHPVNTEAVAWVSSRNNILVSLFSVASFYFYVRSAEELKTLQGMLSLTFFALALLSKEFAVMLLPIFVVYDRVMERERRPFRDAVWGYLAFFSIFCGYLLFRKLAIHDLLPVRHSIGDLESAFCLAPYLFIENVRLILFPAGLHNFIVRYPETCFGKEGLIGIAGVVLISFLVWKWRKAGIFLFSCLSFALALFPVLNILPTSAHSLISMRWLYFPMCFLSFSAALILGRMAKSKRSFLSFAAIAALAGYMGFNTFALNKYLWNNQEDFFHREVVVFGNDFYAGDLGRIYHRRGEYKEAEHYYEIAKDRPSPDKTSLWLNYAGLLVETGRPEAALAYLAEAEKLRPGKDSRGILWNNRGAAFFKMKDYQNAARAFEKAVAFAPEERNYWTNLGHAYARCGEHEKAIDAYNIQVRRKGR